MSLSINCWILTEGNCVIVEKRTKHKGIEGLTHVDTKQGQTMFTPYQLEKRRCKIIHTRLG